MGNRFAAVVRGNGLRQCRVEQIRPTQPSGPQSLRAIEIRAHQIRAREFRSQQVCFAQIRFHQIRPAQIRHGKIRAAQIRFLELRALQIHARQVGSRQVRSRKIAARTRASCAFHPLAMLIQHFRKYQQIRARHPRFPWRGSRRFFRALLVDFRYFRSGFVRFARRFHRICRSLFQPHFDNRWLSHFNRHLSVFRLQRLPFRGFPVGHSRFQERQNSLFELRIGPDRSKLREFFRGRQALHHALRGMIFGPVFVLVRRRFRHGTLPCRLFTKRPLRFPGRGRFQLIIAQGPAKIA